MAPLPVYRFIFRATPDGSIWCRGSSVADNSAFFEDATGCASVMLELRNDTDTALTRMIGVADEYTAIEPLHFVNFTDTDDELLIGKEEEEEKEEDDQEPRPWSVAPRVVRLRDDIVTDTLFEGIRIREIHLREGMSVGAGVEGLDALHMYITPGQCVRVIARWFPGMSSPSCALLV